MSEGTTLYCGDTCNHTGPHRPPPTMAQQVASKRCVKCGDTDHWTRWEPKDDYRSEWKCKQRKREEHLCRGCRNCGYTWDEPIRESAIK